MANTTATASTGLIRLLLDSTATIHIEARKTSARAAYWYLTDGTSEPSTSPLTTLYHLRGHHLLNGIIIPKVPEMNKKAEKR